MVFFIFAVESQEKVVLGIGSPFLTKIITR
jgi:hypothetical protein